MVLLNFKIPNPIGTFKMSENTKTTWLMNGLLAVILVLLAGNYAKNHALPSAQAAGGGWETDGIMVLPVTGLNERFILIDTKKQNLCVYHGRANGSFGLVGARSYKYDIEMEDTEKLRNVGTGLNYIQVKQLYENKDAGAAKP